MMDKLFLSQFSANSFAKVHGVVDAHLYLKLEGQNPTGSIKVKSALAMIEQAERSGRLIRKKSTLIETSSGNMALAMSAICAARGYCFVCVTDPNANSSILKSIRAYGGKVVVVKERDANDGYVGSRIAEVERRLRANHTCVWLDQYSNAANARAHAVSTAREILDRFPRPDWLFVGVGTGGTLMGCAELFREESPSTRIVAVDPIGSITFGGSARRRLIPGIGNSQMPILIDTSAPDQVEQVAEAQSIEMCRTLANEHGLMLGGSSGSAIAAVKNMNQHFETNDQIVVICPDHGDRYLDTVYCDQWVNENFGLQFSREDRSDEHKG